MCYFRSNMQWKPPCYVLGILNVYKISIQERFFVGCSALTEQRPMKSLSSLCMTVCPSVCLSVCPSVTNLSQDWIIIHYIIQYIIHDNNWVWYLVMDKAGFLKKELVARIGVKGAKIGPKHKVFAIFSSLAH